jgi:hypothetical protein
MKDLVGQQNTSWEARAISGKIAHAGKNAIVPRSGGYVKIIQTENL